MNTFFRKLFHLNMRSFMLPALLFVSTLLLLSCKKDNELQVHNDQPNNLKPAIVTITPTKTSGTQEGSNDGTISDEKDNSNQNNSLKPNDTSNQVESPTDESSVTSINNGGLYVKYYGNVYYRQYTSQSYEPTGLWGDYQATVGTKKNMMRIKEDGTTETIFEDFGAGNIYITNNLMYLQKPTDNFETIIYSTDLQGIEQKEYGKGTIEGIDESVGALVCLLQSENNRNTLSTINSITGEVTKFDLSVPCEKVLAVHDSFIYYTGVVPYEDSTHGKIKLCRVAIDGTQEKLLVETATDMYDFSTFGTEIPCIQFVGDTIYFSYGGYAGTGNFYQGGKIARIKTDGNAFEVIAGEAAKGEDPYNSFVSDLFYVVIDNYKHLLYYHPNMVEESKNLLLDLETRAVTETDFLVHPEGIPFEYENGVSVYLNAQPSMTNLIPKVDYSSLGLANIEEYYCTVKDVELCGDWVYYKMEANQYEPEVSIGWRDGYRRIKSQVLREEFKGDKKEVLYEY